MDDYFKDLNQQPFADEEKPCEYCGKLTKGRFKFVDNPGACCEECWAKSPVMD